MAALDLTPFILTHNEDSNIRRTVAALTWAPRVVVVDSGSTDGTLAICREFPNVSVVHRPFDSFRGQSLFAIESTGITTTYALALDADMVVTPEFVREFEHTFARGNYDAGMVPFTYCIQGRPLLGSLLRPQIRLFRRDAVTVLQHGHGHKFETSGPVHAFRATLLHDDRKSLERWVSSQVTYSRQEAERQATGFVRAMRRAGLMPPLAGVLAYARAGGPLAGRAALSYAWERVTFECLLAVRMLNAQLQGEDAASKAATLSARAAPAQNENAGSKEPAAPATATSHSS